MYQTFIDGKFDFKPYYKKMSETKFRQEQNPPDYVLKAKNLRHA